jgi:hypothetical protein
MPIVVAAPLSVSSKDREVLEAMARSTSAPHRQVVQARGLLLAANGVANEEIARQCDTTPDTVRRWRTKFVEDGVAGVGRIRPGRGRKPEIPQELVESIVADTLGTTPPDATHWSTRSMAEHAGVGKDTVARIWRGPPIPPPRGGTVNLSNEPAVEEKRIDFVGL